MTCEWCIESYKSQQLQIVPPWWLCVNMFDMSMSVSGAVAQWRSGAVAQWRSGAVAQWRSGAVARTSDRV